MEQAGKVIFLFFRKVDSHITAGYKVHVPGWWNPAHQVMGPEPEQFPEVRLDLE
jgi:hypothetical protein